MAALGPDVASWLRKGRGLLISGELMPTVCISVVSSGSWALGGICLCLCFSPAWFRARPYVPLLLILIEGTQHMFAESDGMAALALTGRLKASLVFRGSNNDYLPRIPLMDTPSKENIESPI